MATFARCEFETTETFVSMERSEASNFNLFLVYLQIVNKIENIDMKNKELALKCKKEMTLKKKLHNELADLKGNIRVY